MKRLIKYWSPYEEIEFSDCSTRYEVLPHLVSDDAGNKELRQLAKQLGFNPIGNCKTIKPRSSYGHGSQTITNTVVIEQKERLNYWGKPDTRRPVESIRLGFITIPELSYLPNVESCKGKLTDDLVNEIYNNQDLDMRDRIDIDGTGYVLIESWRAFHHLDFMGYKLDDFMKLNEANETVFNDSVFSCSECGTWDFNDTGYTYNYRMADYDQLGTNLCNCYDEHCKENYKDNADDHNASIELDTARELGSEGKLEHMERFIGGMTDGRGGWYDGKSCREGMPESVLEEYAEKYPNSSFIFSHDESGQFQTYFSIWRVINKTTNVVNISEARS